ncbi:MAG: hypothetical protein JHC33_08075 [Ignisphaera sp.]|nr:hypothetical protein [Ignisphaera sp.]
MDLGTKLFMVFVVACIVLAGISMYMGRVVIGVALLVLPMVVFITMFIYAGMNDRIDMEEAIRCVGAD